MFRQCIGIPMGTNCASLLVDLFLYSYKVEFLRSMKKSNKKLAKAFNLRSRYIDDLISINNPRFKQFLKDIYPEELVVSETSESRKVVSYLYLLIDISNSDLVCLIFDMKDAFDFDIVNFPDLSGSIGKSRICPHIPPPPPWTTLNWVPKNFRISKKDSSSLCRIPNSADSNSWRISKFSKIMNGFPGIPVKTHKILGKFMRFLSGSPSIYYRISNVLHGVCVDIFWNSPFHSLWYLHLTADKIQ